MPKIKSSLRPKIKMMILCFLLLFLSSYNLFSALVWPIDLADIKGISSINNSKSIYLVCESVGKIRSISDGIIQVVRNTNQDSQVNLPGLIVIQSDDNVLISYLYVQSSLKIGDRVRAGDYIGTIVSNENLYLSMYDMVLKKFIDPIFVLPILNREASIKLLELDFEYTNPNETLEITKRIRSGDANIHLVLKIKDFNALATLFPETLSIQFKDDYYLIVNDNKTKDTQVSLREDGTIKIVKKNIKIPRGYFDIIINVYSPFGNSRKFVFNVFAH